MVEGKGNERGTEGEERGEKYEKKQTGKRGRQADVGERASTSESHVVATERQTVRQTGEGPEAEGKWASGLRWVRG